MPYVSIGWIRPLNRLFQPTYELLTITSMHTLVPKTEFNPPYWWKLVSAPTWTQWEDETSNKVPVYYLEDHPS